MTPEECIEIAERRMSSTSTYDPELEKDVLYADAWINIANAKLRLAEANYRRYINR